MSKLVFKADIFDEGDWIVTVRPDYEKVWKDVPIGSTLSEKEAKIVARWLDTAQRELGILFHNLEVEAKMAEVVEESKKEKGKQNV